MFDLGYSLLMAAKVIVLFTLLYIFIPAQIIRFDKEETFLDKVFISLIHSTIITILIVHLLAFMKLYETFSLLFCYLLTYIVYLWIRGKSPRAVTEALGMKLIVNILDMSEGKSGLGGELSKHLRDWFGQIWFAALRKIRDAFLNPFAGIFLLITLVVAAFIRFKHSIIHSYLGASDSYVILAWTKYLGSNQIYRDGIYPYGHEAVLSALNKVFLVDPYFIIRFVGPLAGFLIVLSVYYVAMKSFKNVHVALVAVFLYGIITDSKFPSDVWRQMSALPMEYSAIFLLPGIHYFNLYLKNNNNKYLLLASNCLALTILIHPYVTVFLSIGYLIILLAYFDKLINLKVILKSFVALALSVMVGLMPMMIGIIIGKEFHGSLGYIKSNVNTSSGNHFSGQVLGGFNESNPFLLILLACSVMMLISSIFMLLLKNKKVCCLREHIVFSLIPLIFYAMFKAQDFGLPKLMDPSRIGIYMALTASITYPAILNFLDFISNNKRFLYVIRSAISIAVFIIIFNFTNFFSIPQGYCLEYDEAVEAYLKIKNTYPTLNWTIISPVEQYQQTIGYGWHYQLWEFVKKISAHNEDEKVVFSTDYIFLFVEKTPLGLDREVNEDDFKNSFPEEKGDLTDFYYRDVKNRTILEAKAFFWAKNYMANNDNMEIFYEGKHLNVYLIKQDSKNPVNLLK